MRRSAVTRPDDGKLPAVDFPWGLKLTILSPTPKALAGIRKDWDKYLAALHRGATLETIAARKTKDDGAAPNGSSIAFLAEFGGHSLLLAADAHPDVLIPPLGSRFRSRNL